MMRFIDSIRAAYFGIGATHLAIWTMRLARAHFTAESSWTALLSAASDVTAAGRVYAVVEGNRSARSSMVVDPVRDNYWGRYDSEPFAWESSAIRRLCRCRLCLVVFRIMFGWAFAH